jgi:peptidyl-prolyl cis-trans isomerase C
VKHLLAVVLVSVAASACRAPAPSATAAATPPATAGAPSPAVEAPTPAPQAKPVPQELPAVLARVNGEAIDRAELEGAVRSAEARAGASIPAEQRSEILRGLLDQLVSVHLLAQEARARKVTVPDADVKQQIDQVRKQFPSEEAFAKEMAANGSSLDRLQKDIARRLQITKLIDAELAGKVTIADKDVSAFYEQNAEHFKEGEAVRASHILVSVAKEANAAQKQEARAKAETLLKKVRAGADFAGVAKTDSQDPGSAPKGGDLGFFTRGEMDPTFEAAAFNLKPGAISAVVETPFGFHIIKQHEQRPGRTKPLAEVSNQIADFLRSQQSEEKTTAFIEQLKAKAKIEIFV